MSRVRITINTSDDPGNAQTLDFGWDEVRDTCDQDLPSPTTDLGEALYEALSNAWIDAGSQEYAAS